MKKIVLSFLMVFVLVSCSISDDADSFDLTTLPVKEAVVPSEFVFGETYQITITFDLPDGCHSFHSLFFQHDANERIVAANAIVTLEAACTLAIIEESHTFDLVALQEADYVFRFWKGVDTNGENIFEEIVVPVRS